MLTVSPLVGSDVQPRCAARNLQDEHEVRVFFSFFRFTALFKCQRHCRGVLSYAFTRDHAITVMGKCKLQACCSCIQVPFFGDQPFWGNCCLAAGVGPRPVPIGRLCKKDLLAAFAAFDTAEMRASAKRVAEQMALENGRSAAVEHFHRYCS